MSVTRDEKTGIKRESLRELAGKAGINLTNYSIPVEGYARIDFVKWEKELQEKEERDVKEREKQWETVVEEYFKKHPWHRRIFHSRGYDAAHQRFGNEFEFLRFRAVDIQRSFLWGKGYNENLWIEPLSRGILLSLAQAQETKQFERFEIWKPIIGVDPILVGFTGWNSCWNPNAHGFGGLEDCRATYKICAWE